ncbi:MAG: fliG [Rickettsiales bacterium]|jgi:flagellar motor switch protein FliG|nr:fliG [Rickettsiales bacterium]
MVKNKKESFNSLSGLEKTAIIMLSVKEENLAKLFALMDDEEIKAISHAMSNLGSVKPEIVEQLIFELAGELSDSASFVGNMENTERLLGKVLGRERVDTIMEEIRGPAGRNIWDKLGNVNEELLASYLKNEYPQTVALILTKVSPGHAARVLAVMPESFSFEVIMRMLTMDAVKKEVLIGIEQTLRAEFISNLSKTQKLDSSELMAEIFNNFDRANEAKFMGLLEENSPEAAEKIKDLMFTFDDLINVDGASIQTLLRFIDKSKLPIALKGTNENIRNLFLNNMSTRASKILVEDMEALGPVRLRDVDDAQSGIINVAKDLAGKGEMVLDGGGGEDELIY